MSERTLNNRYTLESKVGEGGMAITYRATDRLLHRTVAVKVMREQFTADPHFVERFRREAQAAARLTHEHIAGVYDTGSDGNLHYIVMEFVEGTDLKQRLRREGALSVQTALEIGTQIAAALDAAHRAGLVHRDIKPHNILLNAEGKVKVTDFGIAKHETDGDDTGVIMGSAHYISPEQAKGEPTTPRSDLYALGAVLYEMLTGRTMFEGENALAVASKHAGHPRPHPRSLRPEIPPAVEAMVLKCLEIQPQARYQSAAEVRAVITQLLNHLAQEATIVIPTAEPSMDATMVYRRPAPAAAPARRSDPLVVELEQQTPSRGGSRTGWAIFLVFLLLLGGVGTGGYFFFYKGGPPVKHPTAPITVLVPDLSGYTLDMAGDVLAKKGLHFTAHREQSDAPKDTIFRQTPAAGTEVKPAETVRVELWVSTGPEVVHTMPDVSQMSEARAKEEIRQAGYAGTFAPAKHEYSDTISANLVIRTEPEAGLQVDQQEKVTLIISDGPWPKETVRYQPGTTTEEIARDLGTDDFFVHIEVQRDSDPTPQALLDLQVHKGDPIPPQTFEKKANEEATVLLQASTEAGGEAKDYESKTFKKSSKPARAGGAKASSSGSSKPSSAAAPADSTPSDMNFEAD